MNENYNKHQIKHKKEKILKDFDNTETVSSNSRIQKDINKATNNNYSNNRRQIMNENNQNGSTKNTYIKIDLNKYKYNGNKKKEPNSNNNIHNAKKVETINIDLNNIQNELLTENINDKKYKNIVNKNSNRIGRKINQKNKIYKKLKLYRDETGSLSTGTEKMHKITNITNFKNNLNNTFDENRKNNNKQPSSSQYKSMDIPNKVDLNDYNNLKNNNNIYKDVTLTKNNIINNNYNITDPNDEVKKNYYKKINLNKINTINNIEHIYYNNKTSNINKKILIDKGNISNQNKDNNKNEDINNYCNKYPIVEESQNEILLKEKNYLKNNIEKIYNPEEKNKKDNKINSDISNSNLDKIDNVRKANESNNSSVEEIFSYENNPLKNKNFNNIIDREYLQKYLNNNDINKNKDIQNNYFIKNSNNCKEEEKVDFRVSSIKANLSSIENENNEEENISKNYSLPSSKQEKSIKNNNIDINKKDSLNAAQMEESSHYNMSFYDSRIINVNEINSNVNNNNAKDIIKQNRNEKIDMKLQLNNNMNNSISNTNNSLNEYNSYYNFFLKKNTNEFNNIKDEKEFINLLPNNAFKKFLTSKIKYYMDENSIPKNFILEIIQKEKNKKKSIKTNDDILNISDSNSFYKKNGLKNIKSENLEFNNYLPRTRRTVSRLEKDNDYEYLNKKYNRKNIEIKEKYEIKKSHLLEQNKELLNKINILQELINNSKGQMEEKDIKLKEYLNTCDKITLENEKNKKKIENLEFKLNEKNNEVEEKKKKIYELKNINDNLEDKMIKLKKDYINETINNKETKENYTMIKNNYNDIKNQYDLLNIKYQTLSDENYNFRRDKMLYEKEIKTKNIMIENLLHSKTYINQNSLKEAIDKLEIKKVDEVENDYFYTSKEKNHIDKINNINKKNNEKEIIIVNKAKDEDKQKFDEYGFDELISKRDELMRERKNTTNEYYKIPTKNANSSQIKKRNELEIKLDQINNDLAKVRIRINILKNSKKIY